VPRTRENVASGNSSADAQLLGAQADLARAQATYEQAQTADLAWARANVEKSRANAELAKADLARYLPLMEKARYRSNSMTRRRPTRMPPRAR